MKTQVAIVGGGPGGTSCSLALTERGIDSVIIEKESFPRYHIGESMTGECGNAIRALGLEHVMVERSYPIKRGVRVFNPTGAHSFWVPVMARDPETGLEEASTWQVPRDEFDDLMLTAARERGAGYVQGEATNVIRNGGVVNGVTVKVDGEESLDIQADVVVDASGPASFLSRAGVIGRKQRGRYDKQIAIFSQVTGAIRDPGEDSGNTLIFYQKSNHWGWFIPLDEERVSVGTVIPTEYFKQSGLSREDFLRKELQQLNPNLTSRLENINFIEEARGMSNYSYEISDYTGPGYLCVGDSHRFIDPVFSFGLHFAVKEGQFAAEAIEKSLSNGAGNGENPFADYQRLSSGGMNAIQDLIDAFWGYPDQFALATHQKYREDLIDLFAGRVYMDEPSNGLLAIRKILETGRAKQQQAAAS